jgi:hypothetical protein
MKIVDAQVIVCCPGRNIVRGRPGVTDPNQIANLGYWAEAVKKWGRMSNGRQDRFFGIDSHVALCNQNGHETS